jgi:lipopolysaccharide export system protein LptA
MKSGGSVISSIRVGLRIKLVLLFGILAGYAAAQTPQNNSEPPQEPKKTRVDLLHADEGTADKRVRPGIDVLRGNVQFKHEGMFMWCDSALVNQSANSFEAFGNVRMEQGDTLFIYGDYLYYDGLTELAELRNNVKMVNRNTTLLTDSLNYDRLRNLGYYFEGGVLSDETNVLSSDWGEYSPQTKVSTFNHNVKLENPRFTLTSDTLKYNTDTKIATILGPSHIVSEKNHIYSKRGFYHTLTNEAELLDRSVITNEGKQLTGDSLYYDRKTGIGEAFNNVVMNDTINRSMLTGDYCIYNDSTGYAMATNRAVAIDYSQGDSLYMHADTFKLIAYNQNTDSTFREIYAYHKVRIYRTDVQGVCDSLVFNSKDSCMSMYKDPILWNGEQQLLGEEIKMYMNDSTIDWAHIINQALTVEKKDSIHYNQVAGNEMKAYFRDGEMWKADVIGNVQVIFYQQERDSTLSGMNTSEASLLNAYLHNRRIQKIALSPKVNGTFYSILQIPPEKLRLPNFQWFDYIRPRNKEDIFDWRSKKAGETLRKSTRRPPTLPRRDIKGSH